MEVTESEIDTELSWLHPRNAAFLMDATESGITTKSRDVHRAKALITLNTGH